MKLLTFVGALLAVVAFVFACGCKPTEYPQGPISDSGSSDGEMDAESPPSDETGTTVIGAACLNLRKIKCSDGFPHPKTHRTCYNALTSAGKLADVPSQCLSAAGSIPAARECGNANTIRVRCE